MQLDIRRMPEIALADLTIALVSKSRLEILHCLELSVKFFSSMELGG